MKKCALLALITILFSACITETREVVETIVVKETVVVEPNTFTGKYRIYAEDMTERHDLAGTYYEYEFGEAALTDEVFDYGILQAFLYYTKDEKNTLCPLPFSDFLVDENGYQWEEHFTVEFQPGVIKFIQKISDHADELPIAEFYEVLVRFLW